MSSTRTQSQPYSNFTYLFNVSFHIGFYLRQVPRLFQSKLCRGNHICAGVLMDGDILEILK